MILLRNILRTGLVLFILYLIIFTYPEDFRSPPENNFTVEETDKSLIPESVREAPAPYVLDSLRFKDKDTTTDWTEEKLNSGKLLNDDSLAKKYSRQEPESNIDFGFKTLDPEEDFWDGYFNY